MPFYEYFCEEHGDFMEVRSMANRKQDAECPVCRRPSRFIISTPTIKLEGTSGHFPTAADKWARIHERHGKLNGEKAKVT